MCVGQGDCVISADFKVRTCLLTTSRGVIFRYRMLGNVVLDCCSVRIGRQSGDRGGMCTFRGVILNRPGAHRGIAIARPRVQNTFDFFRTEAVLITVVAPLLVDRDSHSRRGMGVGDGHVAIADGVIVGNVVVGIQCTADLQLSLIVHLYDRVGDLLTLCGEAREALPDNSPCIARRDVFRPREGLTKYGIIGNVYFIGLCNQLQADRFRRHSRIRAQ